MDVQLFIKKLDELYENRQLDKVEPFFTESLKRAVKEGGQGCSVYGFK